MGLSSELVKQYEKFSLLAAIAQMDDIGWCPLAGCNSLANLEKAENTGRCQHCEFLFCLDCKGSAHPFKRCQITRVDLDETMRSEIEEINRSNKIFEN